jgi:hypothetical protein
MTVKVLRGIRTLIFRKLCCLAPEIVISLSLCATLICTAVGFCTEEGPSGSIANVNLLYLRRCWKAPAANIFGTNRQPGQGEVLQLRRGVVLAQILFSASHTVSGMRHRPPFEAIEVRPDRPQEQERVSASSGNFWRTHIPLYLLPFAVPGCAKAGPGPAAQNTAFGLGGDDHSGAGDGSRQTAG